MHLVRPGSSEPRFFDWRYPESPRAVVPALYTPANTDSIPGCCVITVQSEAARREQTANHADRPAPARLALQRRAPQTIRRHFFRTTLRVVVLVAGDLATFVFLRGLMWAGRDSAAFGVGLSEALQAVAPSGYLGGWRYGAALLVGLVVAGSYGPGDNRRDPRRVLMGVALGTALALWSSLWLRGVGDFLVHYLGAVAAVSVSLVAFRTALDRAVARLKGNLRPAERVLLVGDPRGLESTEVRAKLWQGERMELVGWVTNNSVNGNGHRLAALRSGEDVWRVLQEVEVDTVVLCGDVEDKLFHEIVEACAAAGCRLLAMSRYDGIGRLRPSLVWYHGLPFVELRLPALEMRQFLTKRLIDFVVAGAGLVLLAPVFAIIALAIKLDSRGPVFFRQERVGRGGRHFRVWKFRTMRNGASDAAHRELVSKMLNGDSGECGVANGSRALPVYKLVKDGRVTSVGRWLRRTSLDELPQLLNVLCGEMSLVGPRPPLPYEVEIYDAWQFERLGVLPGITGLWQVSGRNLLTYRQMCQLDIEYVQRWSLWLDLRILWRTIPVVLFNSGRAA